MSDPGVVQLETENLLEDYMARKREREIQIDALAEKAIALLEQVRANPNIQEFVRTVGPIKVSDNVYIKTGTGNTAYTHYIGRIISKPNELISSYREIFKSPTKGESERKLLSFLQEITEGSINVAIAKYLEEEYK